MTNFHCKFSLSLKFSIDSYVFVNTKLDIFISYYQRETLKVYAYRMPVFFKLMFCAAIYVFSRRHK